MAFSARAHWGRLIAASLAVWAGAFALPHLVRTPDLQENRVMAPFPGPPQGWAALRAYPKAMDAWVADHFAPRTHLIAWLNYARMQLGVSGSPKVIVGKDGWLFTDNGTHLGAARNDPALPPQAWKAWLEALAGRTEYLKARGIPYVVAIAPDKESIYPEQAPAWFEGLDPDRPALRLSGLAQISGVGEVVYMHDLIAHQTRWGLKTFSRHDTHWTGLGAYWGYVQLMSRLHALGLADAPRPIEAFREVNVGGRNKPRDLALMLGVASFVQADYPELADLPLDAQRRTSFLTDKRDWTAPQVVDTGMAGKPVLLLTRDSFSNALLPFLYGHFSRIILAHNQDGSWRTDLVERFHPDLVILEVVENGAFYALPDAPPPSLSARARINHAVEAAQRQAAAAEPRRGQLIEGTQGPDTLTGGDGPDDITGREGADLVDGGPGNDRLRGGQDNDTVRGGAGDDWLTGGKDDDEVWGGPGADIFNAFPGAGLEVVMDFNIADGDLVRLDAGTSWEARQEGADTVIYIDGAKMVLKGVRLDSLPPAWIGIDGPR
ncbi:alginate O-acetyltransferase AlgX-related protein [Phenylobacterium deserti]|uniref:AlgX/AlgJ SGNH hydrolase-like domain-containing protein n=1 Tax=Phenylobacterium deserti TaxID=1914756 RepID=A0A328ARX3_9CAUL|nr:hypothetical protein [Phenylobacterium deserti]RAK57387.1 hypothetical protein DJ018_05460 [Phenylobacterium deserti]